MTDEQDSRFRIYQHDARELKSRLEAAFDDTDGLVDTIITSPPYADLVDYGDHEEQVGKQDYEGLPLRIFDLFISNATISLLRTVRCG